MPRPALGHEPITLHLHPETITWLRVYAATHRISLSAVTEKAIRLMKEKENSVE